MINLLAVNIEEVIAEFASMLWGAPTIILLLGTHLFLTIRLKFPQRYIFKAIKLSVTKDPDSKGDVSQFGALAVSLAATIGTGNIIGVSTAIALGGPGAVFWCWVTGILGIATKYAEGLLAVKYRVKSSDGTMLGGPMYALERGLGMKWLAVLFCIFTAIASLGIGNTIQSNAISTILAQDGLFGEGISGISVHVTGIILALCLAPIILFGLKGITKVCQAFVPFMAIAYILACIFILISNSSYVLDAISLIARSAFDPEALGGGFVGTTIMMTARYGIARGLFSNESGLGSAPIVAAAAQTRNPVRQALVSSTGTFWDTVIICALTGIVLVSSAIAYPDISYNDGAKLAFNVFDKIPYVGSYILTFGIITFAFSTILGWGYYAEKAIEYLGGKRVILAYRLLWIVLVYFGAVWDLSLVWNIADGTNALMAIPNLVSLLLLSGVLVSETRKYLWSDRLDAYSRDDKSK